MVGSCLMYSAYKLNRQGDNTQPWCTPFPILNQFIVSHPVLTVASCPAYRSLRRQVKWSGIPISLRKSKALASQWSRSRCCFGIPLLFLWSNRCWKFIPLPYLNPACSSGSSWFMYCSKASLEEFWALPASMWNERKCTIAWQIKSPFRIWNSSTGIPSPLLALFVVMLPKAQLTSHSRMSGTKWVITPLWLSGSWRPFLYSSSVYSCHLFFFLNINLFILIGG